MERLNYKLIRSKRRTIGLEIRPEGVLVRAPLKASQADIDGFIGEHLDWIEKHLKKAEELKAKTEQQKLVEKLRKTNKDVAKAAIEEYLKEAAEEEEEEETE